MFAHMPIIRDIIYGAVRQGASFEKLCSLSGISITDLNDSEKLVPFEQAYRVWEHALKLTRDPWLGLHIGERTNATILGLVGHLVQSSRTPQQAFEKICEHNAVVTDMFFYKIKQTASQVSLVYEPAKAWRQVSPETARHAVDQAMAGTLHVFEWLTGHRIVPESVTFTAPQPSSIREYERVFKVPVRFNASANALLFQKMQLNQPVISYNQSLFSMFDELVEERKKKTSRSRDFVKEVMDMIMMEFKGMVPSQEIIASRFFMTPRTFQRKMKDEGITYREVATRVKKEMAMRWLTLQNKKVEEIATLLGYSEPSAFQRAFKNWSNVTPGKIRRSV